MSFVNFEIDSNASHVSRELESILVQIFECFKCEIAMALCRLIKVGADSAIEKSAIHEIMMSDKLNSFKLPKMPPPNIDEKHKNT